MATKKIRVRSNRLMAADGHTLFRSYRDTRGRLQVEVFEGEIRHVTPPEAETEPPKDSGEKTCLKTGEPVD